MKTARAWGPALAMMGVARCATSSRPILAAGKRPAVKHEAAAVPAQEWARSLLNSIHGINTAPPANLISSKYTSGALMGNGDPLPSQQTFWFGKSDFWGSHWKARRNNTEVSILSLGHITLSSTAKTSGAEAVYRVDQDILHARLDTTLKLGGATVHLRSWTADDENLFLTEVRAEGNADVPLTLTLAMPAPDPVLLQHEDGVMRLFPDWPSSMDASFTRLGAKGAFLVSSEQRGGRVVAIDIISEKGGPLTIQSPWNESEVMVSGAAPLKPDATGRISLNTPPGRSYHLTAR